MNLAERLQDLEPRVRPSSWSGHEHFRGYAVMSLPLSSGHLLGLRVFPDTDFAPYASVWHRTPEGEWSIHNDGPSLDTTCPRWWGPALAHADLTSIVLEWTASDELRVRMAEPRFEWTLRMTASPLVRAVNRASAALPLWTWKPAPFLRVREWVAKRFFGLGDLRFSFAAPAGQDAVIMPEEIYFISEARATLEGRDLGEPVDLAENPTIGGVPLPTRPTFVIGQAHGRIADPAEYRRTRRRLAGEANDGGGDS